jgi:hypothetical protein
MRAAWVALSAMEDSSQFPSFGSERSGEIFAALVANDYLASARDRATPSGQRIMPCADYFNSLNQTLAVYFKAFMQQKVPARDVVELQGALLEGAAAMAELVDEHRPTLNPADPSYSSRMEGLRKSQRGMAMMVEGALTCLTETHLYGLAERRRLLEHCAKSVPGLIAFLEPTQRQQLLSRMEALSLDPKLTPLRKEIAALHRASQEAVKERTKSAKQ